MTADPADRGHDGLLPKPLPRPDQTAYWEAWELDVQRTCERIEGTLDKLPKRGEP